MAKHEFEATLPSTRHQELIRIADAMSTATRIDVKKFKQTLKDQGDLISDSKGLLTRLGKVYEA